MICTLKIKQKYFDAILAGEKNFELRHKEYKKDDVLYLQEINDKSCDTGKHLFVKVVDCVKLTEYASFWEGAINGELYVFSQKKASKRKSVNIWWLTWYDEFCRSYIDKKQTYLIKFRIIPDGEKIC